ncbi:MAG: glycosyltransferase [Thermoleophilia bacterium]|nr:glycosyltransferase [Thermoleophilia bacterium]
MSRILIAGGGTAGHVVPALAIADILTERGYEVSFAGGPGGMEGTLVPKAGYPFDPVRIRGFTRKLGFSTLRTLGSLPVAAVDAWRVLRRLRPACVVGVGAYASGPVVAEAAVLGVPAVAVEMDAHLGVTNRILSHLVDRVCLGFPIPGLEGGKYVHTGRPIRPALLQATREEGLARFGLDPHRLTLLAFGGSLGARSVNSAMLQAFAGVETGFQIVHVTGSLDYGRVETELGRGREPAVPGPCLPGRLPAGSGSGRHRGVPGRGLGGRDTGPRSARSADTLPLGYGRPSDQERPLPRGGGGGFGDRRRGARRLPTGRGGG